MAGYPHVHRSGRYQSYTDSRLLLWLVVMLLCYSLPGQDTPQTLPESRADSLLLAARQVYGSGNFKVAAGMYEEAERLFYQEENWEYYFRAAGPRRFAQGMAGAFTEAEADLIMLVDSAHNRLGEVHKQTVAMLNYLGALYVKRKNPQKGIPVIRRAIHITQQLPQKDSIQIGGLKINLGGLLSQNGEVFQAIEETEDGILHLEESGNTQHSFLTSGYNNLSGMFRKTHDLNKALKYAKKAFDIQLQARGAEHYLMGLVYNTQGLIYHELEDFSLAEKNFRNALAVYLKNFGPNHPSTSIPQSNLARVLIVQDRHQEAIDILNGLVQIRLKDAQVNPWQIGLYYLHLASGFHGLGIEDEALVHFDRAIEYFEGSGHFNRLHPIAHFLRGGFFREIDNLEASIAGYQKGYQLILSEPEPTWENIPPDKRAFFAQYITGYARTWHHLGRKSRSIPAFERSLRLYGLSIRLSEDIRSRFKSSDAQMLFTRKAGNQYEDAIRVCMDYYALTKNDSLLHLAFSFIEKSKAQVLLQSLASNEARTFSRVPQSINEREIILQTNWNYALQMVAEKEMKKKGSAQGPMSSWEIREFELSKQYEALVDSIEAEFPRYYDLKYNRRPVPIKTLQTRFLDAEEALISYFYGRDSIYAFAISREAVHFHVLPTAQIRSSLYAYLGLLKDKEAAFNRQGEKRQIVQFDSLSHLLYTQLVAPLIKSAASKLIIVPDGMLNYLPFEVLCTQAQPADEPMSYRNLSYMLRSYSIRYAYSATVMSRYSERARSASGPYLGYAPDYPVDDLYTARQISTSQDSSRQRSWASLAYTLKEVEQVANMLSGRSVLGPEASEAHFKAHAGDYDVLHLAMHGFTNDKQPQYAGLVFSPPASETDEDGLLHAYEIYNLHLNSELTVLSACETGVGAYFRGEGLMSLAHAFTYAGSPNIVTSLWQVDDAATSRIISSFFRNLENGTEKDESLRQAKIEFLQQSDQIHPYYWGGMVLIGDKRPLKSSGNRWITFLMITGGIGIVLLGVRFLPYFKTS